MEPKSETAFAPALEEVDLYDELMAFIQRPATTALSEGEEFILNLAPEPRVQAAPDPSRTMCPACGSAAGPGDLLCVACGSFLD